MFDYSRDDIHAQRQPRLVPEQNTVGTGLGFSTCLSSRPLASLVSISCLPTRCTRSTSLLDSVSQSIGSRANSSISQIGRAYSSSKHLRGIGRTGEISGIPATAFPLTARTANSPSRLLETFCYRPGDCDRHTRTSESSSISRPPRTPVIKHLTSPSRATSTAAPSGSGPKRQKIVLNIRLHCAAPRGPSVFCLLPASDPVRQRA